MDRREEVVAALWRDVIRPNGDVEVVRRNSDAAALLDAGCSEETLLRLLLNTSYEAVFGCLYEVTDGIDDEVAALHEDLLSGDPTGFEGSDFL